MKFIDFNASDILEGFRSQVKWFDLGPNGNYIGDGSKLYVELYYHGTFRVDKDGDLEVYMNNERYWVVTSVSIEQYGKGCNYEVNLIYEIKKNSKYSETLFKFAA